MDPATIARLREGTARLGVAIDDSAFDKLARYLALLVQWNQKINLTAITEPREIVDRHFLDSLAVLPLLGEAQTLVDVGSGAGFPGAVLAIARPTLRVTCVESIRKKVAFVQTLRGELAPNLEPVCARDEELRGKRQFEAAVSRATWDPPIWLEHGAPLVAAGGVLIAMQTVEQPTLVPPVGFVAQPVVTYEIAGVTRRLAAFRAP